MDNEKILEDVKKLKKDVYFSYISKMNLRYLYTDIFTIIERFYLIYNQLHKDNIELEKVLNNINTKEINLNKKELEDIEKKEKTNKITLDKIKFYYKNFNFDNKIKLKNNNLFIKKEKQILVGLLSLLIFSIIINNIVI